MNIQKLTKYSISYDEVFKVVERLIAEQTGDRVHIENFDCRYNDTLHVKVLEFSAHPASDDKPPF